MRKQIFLKPIRESKADFDKIEAEILRIFKREIYIPLVKALGARPSAIQNSKNELIDAIISGRVQYSKGHFKGRFSSTLSRELRKIGAEWDRKQGSFSIPQSKLPMEIRDAIARSESKFQDAATRIDKQLEEINPAEIAGKVKVSKMFDSTLWKVEDALQRSVKDITVAPKLTQEQADRITAEYTENMQLYIQDWLKSEIVELRKNVSDAAYAGVRYEGLIDEIQKSYGVSQNKAKFLARQETNLMMTKFKQVRYQAAGVEKYKWTCVHNPKQPKGAPYLPGEVRYHHAILDGKIFEWNNPPVVNEQGERKNPGQDYNCRCVAIPVVSF